MRARPTYYAKCTCLPIAWRALGIGWQAPRAAHTAASLYSSGGVLARLSPLPARASDQRQAVGIYTSQ